MEETKEQVSNEEYVRSVWETIRVEERHHLREKPSEWHGYVIADKGYGEILLGSGNRIDRMAAAAEFTRNRQEEVRQLERDVAGVRPTITYLGARIIDAGENCVGPIRAWCSACRILARLESQLAALKQGMKATGETATQERGAAIE